MKRQSRKEKALWIYGCVLNFYPKEYRQVFGPQMRQTFKDYYNDVVKVEGNGGASFWFEVVKDEVIGILRERFITLKEGKEMKDAWIKQGLLFGLLLGLIQIVWDLANSLGPADTMLNQFLNNSILFIVILFTGIAGFSTARQTGQMKSGTYAGLFTGILGIIIGMGALFVITFLFMDIIRHNAFTIYDFERSGMKNIDEFIIQDNEGATLVGTLFSSIAGVLFGTLGGYFGRASKGLAKP